MRQHPGVWGTQGPWSVRPLARAVRVARGLFLLCVLAIVPVASLTVFIPGAAVAGDDDDRRQREEERRERERERAEREEARRQRQAEREAERAARDREREAARLQREQERQARELERQAREQARAQEREARNEAREKEREERQAARGENSAHSPSATPAAGFVQTPQQTSGDQDTPAKARDSDGAGRSKSGSERADSNSGRAGGDSNSNSSRRGEGTRQTSGQQRQNGEDKRGKEQTSNKDDDDDVREDIALPEPEEPPRTLVEWFKRMGDEPKAQAAQTGGGAGKIQAPVAVQETAKATGAATRKAAAATPAPAAKPKTAAKSEPARTGSKTAGSAAHGGPRRSGFDTELLRLGDIRKRQILASGLDQPALSKVRAMGFKTSASANSPGSTTPVMTLTVPEGLSEEAAQEWLQQALPQARFGPNHVYHIYPAAESARASASPSKGVCRGPGCFAESLLNWKGTLSSCAKGVRIGVIDTSFDMSHPALKDRIHDLKDFRSRPMEAKSDWHGTAVLSVLAGDPASATPGLVPEAQYVLAATFGAGEDGQASADALSVLDALSWLDGKADIINMSFSGPRNDEIELAIRAMAVKGVVFVAAAGNRGPNGPASYPAAYSEVIAVTAVAQDERGYRHATHGDYVDMAAPGVDVFTALPMGKTGLRTGTSFAAPFVTGLLAAMPAARRGVMTKNDLMSRISTRDLGAPGRDPVFGEGLPQAPERCDEIGGVASLPWSPEAQRMSLGAFGGDVAMRGTRGEEPAGASAMGWAMGFAP